MNNGKTKAGMIIISGKRRFEKVEKMVYALKKPERREMADRKT